MRLSLPSKIALQLALFAGAFIMVTPFLYMISTALTRYAFTLPYPPRLIPAEPTFENFVRAWADNAFARYAWNSLLISCGSVLGVTFLTSLTAYGFSRFQFRGKEILFSLLLISMMVPGIAVMIPTFVVMRSLVLHDSRIGLVLLYMGQGVAFNTFLLRAFFESLPRELEEAVLIDGGGRWRIYRHIILPLSQPALATVAVMNFMGSWDEYWWPLVLIKNEAYRTLPIAIRLFQGMHTTNYSLVFAASLIALIPSICVFLFGQRYFIQGLTAGGVKG